MKHYSSIIKSPIFILLIALAGCGSSNDDDDTTLPLEQETAAEPLDEQSGPVVQPVSGDEPPFGSIENLFGEVTFRFSVTGSGNVAEASVIFTADDEVEPIVFIADDGVEIFIVRSVAVVDERLDVYRCAEIVVPGSDFICVRISVFADTLEFFSFTMDTQLTGSGTYEFCDEDQNDDQCSDDAANSPEGTVDVTITRNPVLAAKSLSLNGEAISSTELRDHMKADLLEFGDGDSNSSVNNNGPELAAAIELMMQELRSRRSEL